MEEVSFASVRSPWRSSGRPDTPQVINCIQRVNPMSGVGGAHDKTTFNPSMAAAAPKPLSPCLLPPPPPPNAKVLFSRTRRANTITLVSKPSLPSPAPSPLNLRPQLSQSIYNSGFDFKSNCSNSSVQPYQHWHDDHVAAAGYTQPGLQTGPQPQLSWSPQQAVNPISRLPSTHSSNPQQGAALKIAELELQPSCPYNLREATAAEAKKFKPDSESQSLEVCTPSVLFNMGHEHQDESLLLASNVKHHNKNPHGVVGNREGRFQGKVDDVSKKLCGLFGLSLTRRPVTHRPVTHVPSSLVRANSKSIRSQSAKPLREYLSANYPEREAFHKEAKLKAQQKKKPGELTWETSINPTVSQTVVTSIPLHSADIKVTPKIYSSGNTLKTGQSIAADNYMHGNKVVKTCLLQDSAGSRSVKAASLMREVASLGKSSSDAFLLQDKEAEVQTRDGHEVMVMNEDEPKLYDTSSRFKYRLISGDSLMPLVRLDISTDLTHDDAKFMDASIPFNSSSSPVSELKCTDSTGWFDTAPILISSLGCIDSMDWNSDEAEFEDAPSQLNSPSSSVSDLKCRDAPGLFDVLPTSISHFGCMDSMEWTSDEAEFEDTSSQLNSPSSSMTNLNYINSSGWFDTPPMSISTSGCTDLNVNYVRTGLELDGESITSTLFSNSTCNGDSKCFPNNGDTVDEWERFTETRALTLLHACKGWAGVGQDV